VVLMKTEAVNETSARLSNLSVGIREFSFSLMQEPTEKQPLQTMMLSCALYCEAFQVECSQSMAS